MSELEAEDPHTQVDGYIAGAMLGLALAVPVDGLLASVADNVLHVYQEIALTEEEVLVTTGEALPKVIALLAEREKPLSLLMSAEGRDTDEGKALLFARLSYGWTYLELLWYQGVEIKEQIEVAERYSRLSRFTSWGAAFLEWLAALCEESGNLTAVCEYRIQLARRLFREKRYEEAVKQGEIARRLAQESDDKRLTEKACIVIRNASFMLPRELH